MPVWRVVLLFLAACLAVGLFGSSHSAWLLGGIRAGRVMLPEWSAQEAGTQQPQAINTQFSVDEAPAQEPGQIQGPTDTATPRKTAATPSTTGLYYQQGLASQLLRVSSEPKVSAYNPSLTYFSVSAEAGLLREYLRRAGMPVPPPDAYRNSPLACAQIVQGLQEPFHPSMLTRGRKVPDSLPGGAPLSLWRWDSGKITRAQFLSTPRDFRTPNGGDCSQCVEVQRYKILQGRLYSMSNNSDSWAVRVTEDMLSLCLHLYQLPDMDFIIHLGDGAVQGFPVIATNINRENAHAGFTLPYVNSFMWEAQSLQQMVAMAECNRIRHPRETAIPRAVWRGSTSDPAYGVVELSNIGQTNRYRLHMLSDIYPEVLDARLTKVIQTPDGYNLCGGDNSGLCKLQSKALAALIGQPDPIGTRWLFSFDDMQKYALLLDVDGNSWSSRMLQLLAHSAAPIIKQASPLQTWYEHLFSPDGNQGLAQFARNLSDAPQRASQVLNGMGYDPVSYHKQHGLGALTNLDRTLVHPSEQGISDSEQREEGGRVAHTDGTGLHQSVRSMNDVAAILLNRWSQVEAIAYSLKVYAGLCDWTTVPEPGFRLVPFDQQKGALPWIPVQLKAQIIKSQLSDPLYRAARGS